MTTTQKQKKKKFAVQYFSTAGIGRVDSTEDLEKFKNRLYDSKWLSKNKYPHPSEHVFFIRSCDNVRSENDIDLFCLYKVRTDNFPTKFDTESEQEQDLDLKDQEGLAEKAYFAYDRQSGNIAFQCNGNVCYGSSLPGIMCHIMKEELITTMPSGRHLQQNDDLMAFELAFSVPGPKKVPNHLTSLATALNTIGDVFGLDPTQTIKLGATLGKDKNKEYAKGQIIKNLPPSYHAKGRAWVKNMEEDNEHISPGYTILELMGGVKKSHIKVIMVDRYPDEEDIAKKLRKCLADLSAY